MFFECLDLMPKWTFKFPSVLLDVTDILSAEVIMSVGNLVGFNYPILLRS